MTLTAYNLFKVFTNTKQGEKIGNKTLKRVELERRRLKVYDIIVYSGDYFALLSTQDLVLALLKIPEENRTRLGTKIIEIL